MIRSKIAVLTAAIITVHLASCADNHEPPADAPEAARNSSGPRAPEDRPSGNAAIETQTPDRAAQPISAARDRAFEEGVTYFIWRTESAPVRKMMTPGPPRAPFLMVGVNYKLNPDRASEKFAVIMKFRFFDTEQNTGREVATRSTARLGDARTGTAFAYFVAKDFDLKGKGEATVYLARAMPEETGDAKPISNTLSVSLELDD